MGAKFTDSPVLSDDEKKARRTFRPNQSVAVMEEKRAAKVVTGPWLHQIPEPGLPLGDVGRKKYDELTKMLFDQNKLTVSTVGLAEQAAVLYQEQHKRLTAGRDVPAYLADKIQRALSGLKIAENAAPITNPDRENKFQHVGFAHRARPAR